MTRTFHGFLIAGFAVAALHTATPVRAQAGTDPAAARVLFARARGLVQEGKYDQACPQFEESLRLDPGIGTLFNLADCYEKQGRVASAWTRFLEAASGAKLAGQGEREKIARDRAAALEPRLPRLTIDVQGAADGLEIRRDGVLIGRPLWGTAVPVDPGPHQLVAQAPSRKTWKTTVEVPAAGGAIGVTVPALEAGATESTEAPSPAATPSAEVASTASDRVSKGPPRALAYVGLGVGVVGVGLGTVFALKSHGKHGDVDSLCPDDRCPVAQRDEITTLQSDASSAGKIATAAFIVGGVGAAAGVTLLLLGHPKEKPAAASVTPFLGPGSIGMVGRF